MVSRTEEETGRGRSAGFPRQRSDTLWDSSPNAMQLQLATTNSLLSISIFLLPGLRRIVSLTMKMELLDSEERLRSINMKGVPDSQRIAATPGVL